VAKFAGGAHADSFPVATRYRKGAFPDAVFTNVYVISPKAPTTGRTATTGATVIDTGTGFADAAAFDTYAQTDLSYTLPAGFNTSYWALSASGLSFGGTQVVAFA
jgi:hypothetical protein